MIQNNMDARNTVPCLKPPNRDIVDSRRKRRLLLRDTLYVSGLFKLVTVVERKGVTTFAPGTAVKRSLENMWMNRRYRCLWWLWCIFVVYIVGFW